MSNILDLVKEQLKPSDQVQHHYRTQLNREAGVLVLTNNKLIFFEEKRGLLRTSYRNTMEVLYENISKVTTTASHTLELKVENKKYNLQVSYKFVSIGDITAKVIVEQITELSKQNQG